MDTINWNNPQDEITEHFSVHDALWLPSWKIYHDPSDMEKSEIIKIAGIMEKIRLLFNKPIIVHCWMRPNKVKCKGSEYDGKDYNKVVKGARFSPHITGQAVDFHVKGLEGTDGCAKAREIILPHLEEYKIRMENIVGPWVHLDTKNPIIERFFKPY